MKLFVIAIAALGGAGVSCGATPIETEKEIRTSLATWVENENRGDHEKAQSVWAPDVKGWFPKLDLFTYGASAKLAGVGDDASAKGRSTYELQIDEVMVSVDLAVVRDTWREIRHYDGGPAVARTIKGYEVWKPQSDGKWRIVRWISSPEPWELPEPANADAKGRSK